MTIEQRLDRLETQNRRLRFGGMFLLLGFGAVFLMGQAKGVPEEIRARSFKLMDDEGKVRARLGFFVEGEFQPAPGVVLELLHPSGNVGASLQVGGPYAGRLSLITDGGGVELEAIYGLGGALNLRSRHSLVTATAVSSAVDGSALLRVGLRRESSTVPRPAVELSANNKDGPSVKIYDAEGQTRATLGVEELINPKTGVETRRPENSLVLFNADGKVVHEVP